MAKDWAKSQAKQALIETGGDGEKDIILANKFQLWF